MIDTLARQARAFSLFTDAQSLISELIPAMRYSWHITNELHLHALISIIGSSVCIAAIWENGLVVGLRRRRGVRGTLLATRGPAPGSGLTRRHSDSQALRPGRLRQLSSSFEWRPVSEGRSHGSSTAVPALRSCRVAVTYYHWHGEPDLGVPPGRLGLGP